ncbi:MAG TPA: PDZ domain-containing protein [Chthonomonadaceae bacterium]|nr:PDZ domain-containing protein [Chthonomonadaceae bacterium]
MRTPRLLPLLLLLGLLYVTAAGAQSVISYHVSPDVADKTYHIQMDIPHNREPIVRVQIPVWSPGAYIAGDYAANIADLSATDAAHKPLTVYHPDQNTWEIAADGADTLSVQYTVKNVDLEEADGAPRHGHLTGPRTYLYVVGRKAEPVALEISDPPGAKAWPVATSLDPVEGGGTVHRFTAPSYDVLADAPVEMGDFAEETFTAADRPHYVVLYGQYDAVDRKKLVDICRRVAETETAFFGGAPYHRYIFEFRAAHGRTGGGGGLEHLGSTEIGTVTVVDDRLRAVIAHEFFHLWNVKRIRPFVLGPFDYVDPPHTNNLWWCEGVTDYYADLLSRRGGLITDDDYLKHLGDTITTLQNNPARLKVSADESSWHVWDANNSQGFGGLSYYTKGEMVGLCLDLKIRQVTGGRQSLDDVMRALWAQVKHGDGPGYGEDDIEKTVNRISGQDLSDFYNLAARSHEELPLADCLAYMGLTLTQSSQPKVIPDMQMSIRPDRQFSALMVNSVEPDGVAAKAGVLAGDRLLAVNDQTDMRAMFQLLRTTAPGKMLTLTLMRNGNKIEVPYAMGSRDQYPWQVTVNPSAPPEAVRLRQAWLSGK